MLNGYHPPGIPIHNSIVCLQEQIHEEAYQFLRYYKRLLINDTIRSIQVVPRFLFFRKNYQGHKFYNLAKQIFADFKINFISSNKT